MAIKSLFKIKNKGYKSAASTLVAPQHPPTEDSREAGTAYTKSSLTSQPATNSFLSSCPPISNSAIYNQCLTLSSNPNFPKELVPIVTLLNCQNTKVYHEGDVFLNIEYNNIPSEEQDLSFTLFKAMVKGNQFILYKDDSNFKPVSMDLLEATFKSRSEENSFIITNSQKLTYHIKFQEISTLQRWITAIKLSNYEYTRLNEAYTASLLSAKGATLGDLHVVLAETRFQIEEWCNIKFGKKGKWVSCYSVVSPFEKSRKGKKNGSISFYTSSKTSKKNLILTVSNIENCYAVFPHVDLIDESSLLKIHGDATVYNLGSKNFDMSNRPRSVSLISSSSQTGFRSRSNSVNEHTRTASTSSASSTKSVKGLNIPNTSLYILPKPHNGVKSFEILIRYLIPVYDAFQLYGRPKRLNADKSNPDSLLFGLPSLPRVDILSLEIANQLIVDQWKSIVQLEDHIEENQFNYMKLFNSKIQQLFNSNAKHAGFGDLKTTIYKDLECISPLVKFNNMDITDDNSALSSPKYAFSISDLPANTLPFTMSDSSINPQKTPQLQGSSTSMNRFRSDSLNSNTQRLNPVYKSNGNLNSTLTYSRGVSLLGNSLKDEEASSVA